MLYKTTRSDRDTCTAFRVLNESLPSECGFYLPLRHPAFSSEDIEALTEGSFTDSVASVLNRLLGCSLTGWDIGFYSGRNPVRLHHLKNKIYVAEGWHTSTRRFDLLAKNVADRICPEGTAVSDWLDIAVRTAVWFGIYGEMKRAGIERFDISVVAGDFKMPMAAWYARHWGLPLGNIVCCCNENTALWDLLCYGQMRTGAAPASLERLIYEAGGTGEVDAYLDVCRRGVSYCPGESVLAGLRSGVYASVVSSSRMLDAISGIRNSRGYEMAPATALAYEGLMDCRNRTGQTGTAVVWAETDPCHL